MKYLSDIPKPESFIYLASPYSDSSPLVRIIRHAQVEWVVHNVLSEGIVAYSPIVYFHPTATKYDLDLDNSYWNQFNETFIQICSEIWVLMLEGWEESEGVKWELELSRKLHIPERFIYLSSHNEIMVMDEKDGS